LTADLTGDELHHLILLRSAPGLLDHEGLWYLLAFGVVDTDDGASAIDGVAQQTASSSAGGTW